LLGYDAVWDSEAGPAELLARAEQEGRTLLTRDTLLVERRAVHLGRVRAALVRPDHVADQLKQLRLEQGLHRVGPPRCLACNGRLKPLSANEAHGRVPPYVAATQTDFTYCATCDRITWPATHWADMQRRLAQAGLGEDLHQGGGGRGVPR
jgi:uncharacterized protein